MTTAPRDQEPQRIVVPRWNVSRFVGFDLETHLITDTIKTPRMVCGAVSRIGPDGKPEGYLLSREEIFAVFDELLDGDEILVGANLAFDLGVMANERPEWLTRIFALLEADRAFDVLIAQALDAIAHGHLAQNPDGSDMRKPSTGKQTKRYGLEVVVHQVLGREDAKEADEWRLRYGELDGTPIDDWPEAARRYPVDDVINPLEVAIAMVTGQGKGGPHAKVGLVHRNLEDLGHQVRAHFAEHLACIQGLLVDQAEVARYAEEVEKIRSVGLAKAEQSGLMRWGGTKANPELSKNTKEIKRRILRAAGAGPCPDHEASRLVQLRAIVDEAPVQIAELEAQLAGASGKDAKSIATRIRLAKTNAKCAAKQLDGFYKGCLTCCGTGLEVPDGISRTDKGDISIAREVLEDQTDPDLLALADVGKSEKAATTYLPYLRSANPTIHPSPNPLLVTGRSSYDGVFQQMPRKGKERACIIAGDRQKIITIDFAGIEAVTWSQSALWLVGHSSMAQAILAGRDIHADFASELMNGALSWEEIKRIAKADPNSEAARMRQAAKPCFHPDTEALTRTGWKRIGELTMDDEVAAAIPTRTGVMIEWQQPIDLQRKPSPGHVTHLRSEGIDIRVTDEHRMLVRYQDGEWAITTPAEFNKVEGWANAGYCPDRSWMPDLRLLLLAVTTQMDDGKLERYRCFRDELGRIHLDMETLEIERSRNLKTLLRPGEFTVRWYQPTWSTRYRWEFVLTSSLSERIDALLDSERLLNWRWLQLVPEARSAVLFEFSRWGRYTTSCKKNVDVIQALASLGDRKTRVVVRRSDGRWRLSFYDDPDSYGNAVDVKRVSHDGEVVCLSVPSSYVLVRDGGVPLIVGQCNFGLPGGMGAFRFVFAQKNQGLILCRSFGYAECKRIVVRGEPICDQCYTIAQELRRKWLIKWPEATDYFARVSEIVDASGEVPTLVPDSLIPGGIARVRGGVDFSAACNNFFQSLAAVGAKLALWELTKQCWNLENDALRGYTPRFFMHDEFLLVGPEENAEAAAQETARIMVEQMQRCVPDVAAGVKVEHKILDRWQK